LPGLRIKSAIEESTVPLFQLPKSLRLCGAQLSVVDLLAIEIRGYIDEDGNKRFAQWLEDLDAEATARVTIVLARMEQGNFSRVKGFGSGVFEYRIDFCPGLRICGGTKKRQRQDIAA
jgi:putative addiction module killer protein